MTKQRLVIRDLRQPRDTPPVVIEGSMTLREAAALQQRFTKLKWDRRRPYVYTIGDIALCVEPEEVA
jgi:hypothetical protein